MGGIGGKGSSQSETNQSANNQQVATTSGIALGANSSGNTIQIQSGDVEVAKKALDTSVFLSSNVVEAAKNANQAVLNAAGLSIAGNVDLSKKISDNLTTQQQANIGLLQSVSDSQNQANLGLESLLTKFLGTTSDTLKMAQPQSTAYQQESYTKYYIYAMLAVVGIIAGFVVYARRRS